MDSISHTRAIKVFVVEDSQPIRERLGQMLAGLPNVLIAGEADTPQGAIDGIMQSHPHIVILDYHLIGGTALQVMRQVRPVHPDTVFIVITNHPEDQYRKACMQSGAAYFLDKSSEFERVKQLVAAF